MKIVLLAGYCFFLLTNTIAQDQSYFAPKNRNPVVPGHFADPSLVAMDGRYYIYSTTVSKYMEPVVWVSDDLRHWDVRFLGITGDHFFWAPSMVKGEDNRYYLYYTSGHDFKCHLYVGDTPLGPWTKHGLVEQGFDLQVFCDPSTGKVYGTSSDPQSRPRLVEFESNPKNEGYLTKVLQEKSLEGAFFDYTEGSFIVYRNGWYYLMYSGGKCDSENYKLNYCRSRNIWGPYEDAPNNPVLDRNPQSMIFGPGHHSVFSIENQYFVAYHRQDFYHYPTCSERQICIDRMEFDPDGWIKPIIPTNAGVDFSGILKTKPTGLTNVAFGKKVTSGGNKDKHNPEFAVDQNYATYWKGGGSGFFSVDLGTDYEIEKIIPRFMNYDYFLLYRILYSSDNRTWKTYYDQAASAQKAATVINHQKVVARYVKVEFVRGEDNISLSELEIFSKEK